VEESERLKNEIDLPGKKEAEELLTATRRDMELHHQEAPNSKPNPNPNSRRDMELRDEEADLREDALAELVQALECDNEQLRSFVSPPPPPILPGIPPGPPIYGIPSLLEPVGLEGRLMRNFRGSPVGIHSPNRTRDRSPSRVPPGRYWPGTKKRRDVAQHGDSSPFGSIIDDMSPAERSEYDRIKI